MAKKKEEVKLEEVVLSLIDGIKKITEEGGDIFVENKKLDAKKTYKVKGDFLNNIVAYLEHAEKLRTDVNLLSGAFKELATGVNLNILSMSTLVLKEYVSQHKKSILN